MTNAPRVTVLIEAPGRSRVGLELILTPETGTRVINEILKIEELSPDNYRKLLEVLIRTTDNPFIFGHIASLLLEQETDSEDSAQSSLPAESTNPGLAASMLIEDLPLAHPPNKTHLKNAGYRTVADLLATSADQLIQIKYFKMKSLEDLVATLKRMNLYPLDSALARSFEVSPAQPSTEITEDSLAGFSPPRWIETDESPSPEDAAPNKYLGAFVDAQTVLENGGYKVVQGVVYSVTSTGSFWVLSTDGVQRPCLGIPTIIPDRDLPISRRNWLQERRTAYTLSAPPESES